MVIINSCERALCVNSDVSVRQGNHQERAKGERKPLSLSLLNSFANSILNSDPYLTSVKTVVSYDDLRAGTDRWGTVDNYRKELIKTQLLLEKCGKEHVFYCCPVPGCEEHAELEYNCLNLYCGRGCDKKLSWRKHKLIYQVLKSYQDPRKFEVGWQGHHPLTIHNLMLFKSYLCKLIRELKKNKAYPVIRKWFLVIELVHNPDGFYFHAHVCYDGRYIDQKLLSDLWKKASDGSFYAYIQRIKDRKQACNDVAKYLSKPLSGVSLARWVAVLKKNRMFSMSRNSYPKGMSDLSIEAVEELVGGTYENGASLVNRRSNPTGLTCKIHNKTFVPLFRKEAIDFTDSIPPPKGLRTPQDSEKYYQLSVDGITRCL